MTRSVDIRIYNDMSQIGIVRDALDEFGRELGIPSRALLYLQVALDEVVSNVVKYSWDEKGRHEFLVRITARSDRVDLEVFDDGRQFDPLSAPAPAPSIHQRPRPGGLGIHLARRLVDDFTYERIDGRNHTMLSKKCEFGTITEGRDK